MSDSSNFLTYAQTTFDSFEEQPFCAVDSLVFAWLSYLRLPGDMAERCGSDRAVCSHGVPVSGGV